MAKIDGVAGPVLSTTLLIFHAPVPLRFSKTVGDTLTLHYTDNTATLKIITTIPLSHTLDYNWPN